jgi:hypothetical protein
MVTSVTMFSGGPAISAFDAKPIAAGFASCETKQTLSAAVEASPLDQTALGPNFRRTSVRFDWPSVIPNTVLDPISRSCPEPLSLVWKVVVFAKLVPMQNKRQAPAGQIKILRIMLLTGPPQASLHCSFAIVFVDPEAKRCTPPMIVLGAVGSRHGSRSSREPGSVDLGTSR